MAIGRRRSTVGRGRTLPQEEENRHGTNQKDEGKKEKKERGADSCGE